MKHCCNIKLNTNFVYIHRCHCFIIFNKLYYLEASKVLKKVKETTISSLCRFYVFVRVIFVMLLTNFEVTPRYYRLLKHQSIHTYIVRISTTKHNCITQDTCANFLTNLNEAEHFCIMTST